MRRENAVFSETPGHRECKLLFERIGIDMSFHKSRGEISAILLCPSSCKDQVSPHFFVAEEIIDAVKDVQSSAD